MRVLGNYRVLVSALATTHGNFAWVALPALGVVAFALITRGRDLLQTLGVAAALYACLFLAYFLLSVVATKLAVRFDRISTDWFASASDVEKGRLIGHALTGWPRK